MFSSYRRVFSPSGSVAFTLYGLLCRLSYGMSGISTLTAVADRRGSYALAGAVSAVGLVGVALGMPLLGRLVDRYGQSRVVIPAVLLALVPRTALLLCLSGRAPDWALFCCALAASVSPNIGGMSRARWTHLHRGDPAARHSANSLEQAMDELCFMAGPVLGILLCTALFPEAGLLTATVLSTAGALLFAAQRRTEPPLGAVPTAGPRSPLRTRGAGLLLAAFLATGMVFGSLEITTLAYAGARGHQAAAGGLVGLLAAGSCGSGLAFGLVRARRGPDVRFLLGLAAMAGLLLLPLAAARLHAGVGTLAVVLLVVGTGTAPTMVTGMTLLQEVLPDGTLNEGMALAASALVAGVSTGSALGGLTVQHASPSAGYGLPAAAAVLALLIALAAIPRLRPAHRHPAPAPAPATT